jgi:hypothetical protein
MIFIFSQSYLASSYGAFYANLFLCIFLLMGLILTSNIIERSLLQKFFYIINFLQKKVLIKKDYKRNKVCQSSNDKKEQTRLESQ